MNLSILLLVSAALLTAQSTPASPGGGTGTWNGLLIDDACRMANVTARCHASGDTKSFGLELDGGKYVKLDAGGNNKAQAALAARAKDAGGEIKAAVTGSLDGYTLKTEAVELK